MELTDRELQVITQGATNAHKAQRGIMSLGDMVNEAMVWALSHPKKIKLWREKGKHGENLLRFSAKQHALSVAGRERRRIYQLERGDIYYYTPGMVREILPDIWNIEDWMSSSQSEMTDKIGGVSRPSEGNNRLATIVDVHSAYTQLSAEDQNLLRDLYADGGVTHQVLAATLDVSEKTIQRREHRAVERLVDRLGGELPWWDARTRGGD